MREIEQRFRISSPVTFTDYFKKMPLEYRATVLLFVPINGILAMVYQERYVAFIDILGFGEIIRQTSLTEQRVSSLERILGDLGKRDADWDKMFGDDFRFQTFSDSIVMSENVSETGLLQILDEIGSLATNLLRNGLLMRGGVSKGHLFHKEGVMFGPAFLDAYRIESTIARYPRVVLSREVYADARRFRERVRLADDGPPYINVLKDFQELTKAEPDISSSTSKNAEELKGCRSALQRLINDSIHEPKHFEKLKWFGIYWNSVVVGIDNGVSFPNSTAAFYNAS